MKNFNYTCRKSDGALERGTVQAEDRSDAVSQLKQRGLIVVSVVEGGKAAAKQTSAGGGSLSPKAQRIVLAVLLAVLAAVVGIRYLPGLLNRKPAPKPKTVQKPQAEKPKPAPKTEVAEKTEIAPPSTNATPVEAKKPARPGVGKFTMPNGRELTYRLPEPGKTVTIHVQGKMYEADSEGNVVETTPKKLFDNPIENQLVGMAVDGGMFIPGFLKGLDQNAVIQIMQKPVEAQPDDTEEDLAKRQAVAQLKEAVLAYIENGGTFDDFVDQMFASIKEERSFKVEGIRNISQLLKQGKLAEAKEYRDLVNKDLAEKGFSPLRLPPRFQEQMK